MAVTDQMSHWLRDGGCRSRVLKSAQVRSRARLSAASAPTRAAMCTARSPTTSPMSSTSPVCSPPRISMPSWASRRRMAGAQRIARLGLVNVTRKPSPVVFTARPSKRAISLRTATPWAPRRSRQRRSPSSAARWVDPTMSVNRTVRSTRSFGVTCRIPVRNSDRRPAPDRRCSHPPAWRTWSSQAPSAGSLSHCDCLPQCRSGHPCSPHVVPLTRCLIMGRWIGRRGWWLFSSPTWSAPRS